MKTFRAGVIGTGFIGVAHVEALRRLGNVEVVAITDSMVAEAKAKMMNVPHWYSDYQEMIQKENLDMVHICTPNNTHRDIAIYAMEHGVNVICEKPMCMNATEAQEMVDCAKRTGAVCAINFHNRFYPMTYEIKQMVKIGQLGDIFTVHGEYVQDWLLYDTDYSWHLEPQFSGSSRAVADIGLHWIDLAESVTGQRVVEVFADFATFHKTRKKPSKPVETFSTAKCDDYVEVPVHTEDQASILLKFADGARGNAVISQLVAGRKNRIQMCVSGSKESVFWSSESLNDLFIGHRDGNNELATKNAGTCAATNAICSYPGGHVEGFPDAFKQNFKAIYRSAEDRNAPVEYATFEDGLHMMIVCDKIVASSKSGSWVIL